MNNVIPTFLLACSVLLGGCGQPKQTPRDLAGEMEPTETTLLAEDAAPEKAPADVAKIPPEGLVTEQEPPGMIQVLNLTVTENTLILDHRISNPFQDDILVCHDTGAYGDQVVQHAKTRIYGETAWIILGLNVEKSPGFVDPRPVAKYVWLPPGESCSGRIVLNLPLRDNFRERQERHKDRKQTVLRRAVFDVSYFGPRWKNFFGALSDNDRMDGIEPKPIVRGPYYYLEVSPLITEETLDGKRREVVYTVGLWTSEKDEESETVEITDVKIPALIVADE